ncbi:MAG TPA: M1 family metallopeptidase [Aggregatilineaceae bacterium]|nr:M1 family metallopeptidase [Aggregatilineaceae bacterium]
MRRSQFRRLTVLTALLAGLALGSAGQAAVRAQDLGDWTVPYRPALLPPFVGDMAVHADAPRYTIDLALVVTPTEATLTGHQTVLYTNRAAAALDRIVFRLYPNLESYGGAMEVSQITADGLPAESGLDTTRSVLSILLPQPLDRGASVTLDMNFSVTVYEGLTPLYGQFSYLDGVLALPNAYPVLSVYEPESGWWQVAEQPQGDAVFSETAFYSVAVTAPPRLILAVSGSEVEMVANRDGTLTHHYVAPLMRDFALIASEKYVAIGGEQDGVIVNLYYDPDVPPPTSSAIPDSLVAAATARAGLQMTEDAVRIYDATFGRYPFTELDVVQTATMAGGIEYPGLFVVSSSIWDKDNDFFEWVIAHETAHQWWYSLVGNDQTLHPWMDEALAQYSVAIYIRDREGEVAYQGALDFYRAQYEGYIESNPDQVIGEPVTAYPDNAYFFMIYEKGPLFFAALEDAYGYDAVIRMLQGYLAAYRYQIAGPDDMLASFEFTLGQDLEPIFEDWIGAVPVG